MGERKQKNTDGKETKWEETKKKKSQEYQARHADEE